MTENETDVWDELDSEDPTTSTAVVEVPPMEEKEVPDHLASNDLRAKAEPPPPVADGEEVESPKAALAKLIKRREAALERLQSTLRTVAEYTEEERRLKSIDWGARLLADIKTAGELYDILQRIDAAVNQTPRPFPEELAVHHRKMQANREVQELERFFGETADPAVEDRLAQLQQTICVAKREGIAQAEIERLSAEAMNLRGELGWQFVPQNAKGSTPEAKFKPIPKPPFSSIPRG